jgi:hypothetical protein
MNNVSDFPGKKMQDAVASIEQRMRHGGGNPPYDGDMEARLTALETRLDTILPTLATKIDLSDLRTEMHRELHTQTWRIIGSMLTFGTLLTAIVFYIARNVH